MNINQVMVIGAGQMGAGIAQVCAQSGFHVLLYDKQTEALNHGVKRIHKFVHRACEKQKITEEQRDDTLLRIERAATIQDAAKADLVIEAVVENMDVKTAIFHELDQIAPAHTILASNTSSLSITEIAAATNRPDQVIGMHFMNPVPIMQLVEIIRAVQTSDGTYSIIEQMAKKLNKVPVTVQDFPGFVSNRILMPMINEAIYTLYEGIATVEDIDTSMKLGMNHPMGPLTLADFIGLDTCLYIMGVLHEGFSDSKYRPCPLLKQYVQAGWLGKKTGRGFYVYT
ncbi:3-hydroxybutyryl-CoA dehydrogenase [Virgibacillus pantothenticus]|uniref:3-hydroxybutyryl-CoA dehydrogenase n=1 Tax=Virgibacillus pantothenticus TaxID=1473 RepID=UPI001AFCE336|nr:3-hydroxybutyryl-CoA dehydrogenase [Virgibacillus pantothenticus]MBU8566524.1 3-hydroxybutyryl-CoA dehydrogenase [Virgibacillus pantothenticus]MBU8599016.1 3-hydroxybutyryl-CoA dehydrogenase [Virgibacillus pantothenticus]MBU8634681.1 3-hydroxybutyryl-CoA dehydrogenase [Virgibacillus pantothenticus]MBU8641236.1 3-hydroxybutyryl-CoA dehydrogenase [Virgibacillus pantothenticus]MBU8645314.1 3-hydroxybutyryl-CoA dehydrogenase [Virgibacillus pantothenticus]